MYMRLGFRSCQGTRLKGWSHGCQFPLKLVLAVGLLAFQGIFGNIGIKQALERYLTLLNPERALFYKNGYFCLPNSNTNQSE
jgi:hypothetical protein